MVNVEFMCRCATIYLNKIITDDSQLFLNSTFSIHNSTFKKKGDVKMFLGKIYVTLKKSVLDPQGVTIKHAIDSLGYSNVEDVRMGKYFEVKFNGKKKEVEKALKEICEKLLVNEVIETYSFDLEEV